MDIWLPDLERFCYSGTAAHAVRILKEDVRDHGKHNRRAFRAPDLWDCLCCHPARAWADGTHPLVCHNRARHSVKYQQDVLPVRMAFAARVFATKRHGNWHGKYDCSAENKR